MRKLSNKDISDDLAQEETDVGAQRTGVSRRAVLFGLSQLALFPVGVFAAIQSRVNYKSVQQRLPKMRNQPRSIRPKFDRPSVVGDDQLLSVLAGLRLPKNIQASRHVHHAIRLWGAGIRFEDSYFSGPELLNLFTRHHEHPVRALEAAATFSSHVDHKLGTLTEIGLPLSTRMKTRDGDASLADLLFRALKTFSLNQGEYEWTGLAWALYARTSASWMSHEGQVISFDRLARRMMREPLGHGVCWGGHRLSSLAIMSRIDSDSLSLFSKLVRQEVTQHFTLATQSLVRTQHADGYWTSDWPGYKIPADQPLSPLTEKLVATGQALEWWAMIADERLLPPNEILVRAGQWLVREFEQMQSNEVSKHYACLSGVGRALSLWRGELPADSWRRLNGVRTFE